MAKIIDKIKKIISEYIECQSENAYTSEGIYVRDGIILNYNFIKG